MNPLLIALISYTIAGIIIFVLADVLNKKG